MKASKNRFKQVAIAALLLIGAALTLNTASAQGDDATVRQAVYANLNWSAGDHGYNEGALCGLNALQGIAELNLPQIPFEEDLLGNIWDRTNLIGAAEGAFQLGYTDAAVEAATCSQIHNGEAYQLLLDNPGIVADWLSGN